MTVAYDIRRLREDADRQAIINEARQRRRERTARTSAALANILAPLVESLREQRLDAVRHGQQARAAALQRDQDDLVADCNRLVEELSR